MKKIVTFIAILTSTIAISQTVKPMAAFYTDSKPSNPSEVTTLVYYKDVLDYFTPFLGTWTAQVGTKTFVITIWKETQKPIKENGSVLYYVDGVFGHYKLVQNYESPGEITIYTSEINFINTTTPMPAGMYMNSTRLNILGGSIYDVNLMAEDFHLSRGDLSIEVDSGNPNSAIWKVSKDGGLGQTNFVIPKNLILTKQ